MAVSVDAALTALKAKAIPFKGEEMAAYHKAPREYLGVANPDIDAAAKAWRAGCTLDERLALARDLWDTDIHEARIAAARLLTQARIRPDDGPVWDLIRSWVPDFDAWAIADHASIAGQKRLVWAPGRIEEVEPWTRSGRMWTRRAALVMTLPWARLRDPKDADRAIRGRVLGWAAGYVTDPDRFIQKAVAWWLRDLSKKDPATVRAFLAAHGRTMKAFARREAGKYLGDQA